MTPFGHVTVALLGRTLWARDGQLRPEGLALGAVLPDVDLALEPLIPGFHRTKTHSVAFVALAAWLGRRRFGFASLLLGGLSHLAIDAFLDDRPRPEAGMPLLYPVSGQRFRGPVSLLPVRTQGSTWWDRIGDALRLESPLLATLMALVTVSPGRWRPAGRGDDAPTLETQGNVPGRPSVLAEGGTPGKE